MSGPTPQVAAKGVVTAAAFATLVVWLVVAHNLEVDGSTYSPTSDFNDCLTNADTWARAQAAIAVLGFAAGITSLTALWHTQWSATRFVKCAGAALASSIVAWVLVALMFDPRVAGAVSGCGVG